MTLSTLCSCGAAGFHWCSAAERAPIIGATRACPDCGRPQHYTGTEYGWAHDALIDTWDCADPARHNPVTCRDGDHYGQCSGVTI